MILPIGDTPNPARVAWATWALLAANIAVFVLASVPLMLTPIDASGLRALSEVFGTVPRHASAYDAFVLQHGFKTAAPHMADLFSSLFLHSGFGHLFGNLLFLWIFGDNVEARMGSGPFVLFYLVSGVAATLLYALLAGPSLVPLVGASGAISGVLGAYLVWFPYNRVRLLIGLWPLWLDVLLVPAWVVLTSYLVLENLLPLALGSGGNVAYGAHIGGFLAGVGVALPFRRRTGTPTVPGAVELHAGRMALHEGDLPAAYQHLMRALRIGSPEVVEAARRELMRIPDPRLQAWLRGRWPISDGGDR